MDHSARLRIDGQVARPLLLSFQDLCQWDPAQQVADVSRLDPQRSGDGIRLAALLERARVSPEATHLGLHASRDDFHASIPLAAVRERALVIFRVNERPLSADAGGPFRLFIPDHAACHTHEIDECANVKFLDWIELTVGKGRDNRPADDQQHEALHRKLS